MSAFMGDNLNQKINNFLKNEKIVERSKVIASSEVIVGTFIDIECQIQ